MAKFFSEMDANTQEFINNQKMFFVGTAASDGRVNVSPKGLDSLKILNSKTIIWLNLTGSGNETAAHIIDTNRMTLMFCAFEGKPLILRIYGSARAINRDDPKWDTYYAHFGNFTGARQIFELTVESGQNSCGMAVPEYQFVGDRHLLEIAHDKKGPEKMRDYWAEKNMQSIDGLPTGLTY